MFSWTQLFIAVCLLIPILYRTCHSFKYYVKVFAYYCFAAWTGIALIFTSFFVKRRTDNFKCAGFIYNHIIRRLYGINIEVFGREHLESDSSFIVVSNHQSALDLIGMSPVVPSNCTCLAKKELKYGAGPFGIALWLSGSIFIDRSNREKSMSTMSEVAKVIKRDKTRVWIFPEGKRNENGSLLPFKKGAFHLAVAAQVPVVPIVFSSYSHFYSSKHKIFNTGNFTINILPPVSTEGMTLGDVDSLTEDVRSQMLTVFKQTSQTESPGQTADKTSEKIEETSDQTSEKSENTRERTKYDSSDKAVEGSEETINKTESRTPVKTPSKETSNKTSDETKEELPFRNQTMHVDRQQ